MGDRAEAVEVSAVSSFGSDGAEELEEKRWIREGLVRLLGFLGLRLS